MNNFKSILKNVPEYVAGKNIEEIKKKYHIKRVIKLASNENSYGINSHIKKIIKKNINNVFRYPDSKHSELKSSISEKLKLSPDNIILGNGTDEILDMLFKYKSDRVVTFKPSFSLYKILCKIYGSKVTEIELDNFEYNVKKILKTIRNKKSLIIICNPNNPTGTYINENDMAAIIEQMGSKSLLVVDEAYFHYSDALDFPDMVELFKRYQEKRNIVVTRTFSKIYSLAGLRIGYAFGNKEIIKVLDRIRMPFNINYLANVAAIESLKNDKVIENIKLKNRTNKKFLYDNLDKLHLEYVRSEANFVLVKIPLRANRVFDMLLKKGIIVRPINEKGMENYIRVTIGTKGEIKKFLKSVKRILN